MNLTWTSDAAAKVPTFKPGKVMITGNWAQGHNVFYYAARRTNEGGRKEPNRRLLDYYDLKIKFLLGGRN